MTGGVFGGRSPALHSQSAAIFQTYGTTPPCSPLGPPKPSQILSFTLSGNSLSRASTPIGCRPSKCHPSCRSVLSTILPVCALLGVFAFLALLLAAVGLFSVLSYLVTQRTREIGIRLALGSPIASVRGMILGDGLKLAGAGCLLGLVLALAASQLLSRLLLNISPWDVPTLIVVTVLLLLVAFLATAIPAWRATRVNPMIALRQD